MHFWGRRAIGAATAWVFILLLAGPQPVRAQTPDAAIAPPTYKAIDVNGVDLVSGTLGVQTPSISIGPADGGLTFSMSYDPSARPTYISGSPNPGHLYGGGGFRSNFDGGIYYSVTMQPVNGVQYYIANVSFQNTSEMFISPDNATWTSATQSGATLVGTTYTARDGTVAVFGVPPPVGEAADWSGLTSITKPNGETLTYVWTVYGLQAIASNRGYQIHYTYDPSSPGTVTQVMAINTAVDSCDPSANVCSGLSQAWPTLAFSYNASTVYDWTMSVTDVVLGHTTTYALSFNPDAHPAGSQGFPGIETAKAPLRTEIRRTHWITPGSGSGNWTDNSTVNDGAGTWTYAVSVVNGLAQQTIVTDPNGNQRTVNTNPAGFPGDLRAGKVGTDFDVLNHRTAINYDSQGRITSIYHPEGDSEHYDYDSRSNVTAVTKYGKSGGNPMVVSQAGYPTNCTDPGISAKNCNEPLWTKDANGNETDYSYSAIHGGLLTVTAPAPRSGAARPQTTYTYTAKHAVDGAGNPLPGPDIYLVTTVSACRVGSGCTGGPDEQVTTIDYRPQNLVPITVTQKAGDGSVTQAITTVGYDFWGNVTSVTDPTSVTTSYVYNGAGRQQIGVIGANPVAIGPNGPRPNPATRTTYTADGLVQSVEMGTAAGGVWANFAPSQTAITTYDALDRKIQDVIAVSGGGWVQQTDYSYDVFSRLLCKAVRMNAAVFGANSDACSQTTNGPDGPDRITRNSWDNAGRLTAVIEGYGTSTPRTYQSSILGDDGETQYLTDANNNTTTYFYDDYNRLGVINYPSVTLGAGTSNSGDAESFTLDNVGNVTAHGLRGGGSLSMGYDALNRKTTDQNGAALDYDNFGDLITANLTTTSLGAYGESATYDALGHQTSETGPLGTISYQYDAAGRLTRITWPDGFYVTYDHDAAGEVTTVKENGTTALATYSYDNLGRRWQIVRGNGANTQYDYDGVSRLQDLSHYLPAVGAISQGVTTSFGYNAASQISSMAKSNPAYEWAPAGGSSRTSSPNGVNQTTQSGPYSLAYSAHGNLLSDQTNHYDYSATNQLTNYSVGSTSATLDYDGLGRLVRTYSTATTTTRFAYSGDQLLAEYDGNGALLRRYVPGADGSDDPIVWYEWNAGSGAWDRRWLHADQQGSVVAVTDGSGNWVGGAPYVYDEYGVPGAGQTGRFQYTGQLWLPEEGLYHYKARAYSPTLGKFLQTDPIGYQADMNMYAYVGNDPVNMLDPFGMDPLQMFDNSGCCDPANFPSPDMFFFDPPSSGGFADFPFITVGDGGAARDGSGSTTVPGVTVTPRPQNNACAGSVKDAFFAKNYGPAAAVAAQYNVDPALLLGLSIHESGWGGSAMARNLNNPFGATPGGGTSAGIQYASTSSAWQSWGRQWGPRVAGVGGNSFAFVHYLGTDNRGLAGAVDSRGAYNSQIAPAGDPNWANAVMRSISGVRGPLANWLGRGCGG